MERWKLYSALKGYHVTPELIAEVEQMVTSELREGVIEFLLMLLRTKE